MKKIVGAYEAKTHLPRLLKSVSHGNSITITHRGNPIALLIPATPTRTKNTESIIKELRELRQGITWGASMSTQKAKQEGRK